MKSPGSPLRFLALLLGGWVCARAAILMSPMWEMSDYPTQLAAALPGMDRSSGRLPTGGSQTTVQAFYSAPTGMIPPADPARSGTVFPAAVERMSSSRRHLPRSAPSALNDAAAHLSDPPMVQERSHTGEPIFAAPIMPARGKASRWSGAAWLLWRPEADGSGALLPLLGGSQAGARLDYRLAEGAAGQLSLYGRASRAMTGPSSEEAALGLAWRPAALPVSLLVERRQRLGPGGRTGFAAIVAAGLDAREIAPRVEVEGYAQAGIVGLPGHDVFADGRASLAYRLTAPAERSSLMLGGMIASSAQPGVERLDIGPEIRLRLPVGQGGLRLSAEWRARIAGNARPASGPAITLITDF